MFKISKSRYPLLACAMLLLGVSSRAFQDQGARKPGTHQDLTDAKTWIQRLERPERIPGLKTKEVIACLKLKPGNVIADIGAGIKGVVSPANSP